MSSVDNRPIPYQLTPAALAALGPTPMLPAQVRELLEALHEALSVPLAAYPEDDEARTRLLESRTSDARAALSVALQGGEAAAHLSTLTGLLRRWTAEQPVTFTPFQRREVG